MSVVLGRAYNSVAASSEGGSVLNDGKGASSNICVNCFEESF